MQTVGNVPPTVDILEADDQIILHEFNLDHDHDQDHTALDGNNCKGDNIASVPTNSSADANLSDGIVLTNEDQNIVPTPEKSPAHKDHRKISEELFEEAYRQRKMDNLRELKQYEDSRSRYCFLYVELLKQIENTLYQKTHQSRLFVSELVTYFTETVATYRLYAKECSKANALSNLKKMKNKSPLSWYSQIEMGVWQFTEVRQDHIENTKTFYRWVQKELIPRLNSALKDYNSSTNRRQKELQRLEEKIQEKTIIYSKRLDKILFSLTASNEQDPTDLLFEELELFELYENLKQKLLQFGKFVNSYWENVQNSQESLYLTLRRLVKDYLLEHGKVNGQSEKCRQIIEICDTIQAHNDELFGYIWERNVNQNQKNQLPELTGSNITTKKELDTFINMQSVSTQIPEHLLRTLTTKRFKAIVQNKPTEIFRTVDGYLILLIQGEPKIRMAINKLTNTLENNTVILKERQKSLFIDTFKKETIKFDKTSDAQEFMFYAQHDQEKRQSFCLPEQ